MANAVQYMIDEKGAKKSVLIPIKTWEKLNGDFAKLQKKLQVFEGIKNSLEEIKEAKKTGKKLQTLKDFLSESNN
jgi:proteasome assembly chaperone (PAC2) family protein